MEGDILSDTEGVRRVRALRPRRLRPAGQGLREVFLDGVLAIGHASNHVEL